MPSVVPSSLSYRVTRAPCGRSRCCRCHSATAMSPCRQLMNVLLCICDFDLMPEAAREGVNRAVRQNPWVSRPRSSGSAQSAAPASLCCCATPHCASGVHAAVLARAPAATPGAPVGQSAWEPGVQVSSLSTVKLMHQLDTLTHVIRVPDAQPEEVAERLARAAGVEPHALPESAKSVLRWLMQWRSGAAPSMPDGVSPIARCLRCLTVSGGSMADRLSQCWKPNRFGHDLVFGGVQYHLTTPSHECTTAIWAADFDSICPISA